MSASVPSRAAAAEGHGPAISIIIPTFNRAPMVCACVSALLASDFADFEIIVVDDCSPDDTGEQIAAKFAADPRVKYTRNAVNKQLGGSRNVGARLATGRYLLFIDDDNLVCPDLLGKLVADFDSHSEAGLIAPMAINVGGKKDGLIWTLGCDYHRWTSKPNDYLTNLPRAQLPTDRVRFPTLYCPNAFAVPRAVHEEVGGFCEDLPFYYDDADYGWRIAETGRKAWILSTAVTMHQNFMTATDAPELRDLGINAPWRAYRLARNRLRFARRHFSFLQILSVTFIFAPLSAVYYGWVAAKNHRFDIAWAYVKGTLCGICGM